MLLRLQIVKARQKAAEYNDIKCVCKLTQIEESFGLDLLSKEGSAKMFFQKHNVLHYWQLCDLL